jgi:hypothetical protein
VAEMILYHGSNVVVKSPRIIRSPRTLDFGEGFYTTTNKQQAKIFAQKVFARRKSGNATVTVYEMNFELALAASELCVLRFQSPDENWLDYVTQNRGSSYTGQLYDIVLGPVANDDVYATLSAFEAGILTKEQTITALKIKKLYDQFVLKSAEALLLLQYQESFTL